MGYRGKQKEQARARELRAESWTLQDIANELGVAKGSVSVWVRDVPFTPSPRRTGPRHRPHPGQVARLQQIDDLNAEGMKRLGDLDERAFLAAGAALYAGEGSKTDGKVVFANSDAAMIGFFCRWLRAHFEIDESRLRARVYLHEGLDIDRAEEHWSVVTGIPRHQFFSPYRALADASIRHNKHQHGCAYVTYSCCRTHRAVMGLVRALLSSTDPIRGGATGSAIDC